MDDWEDLDVDAVTLDDEPDAPKQWEGEDAHLAEDELLPPQSAPAQPLESTLAKPKKQKQLLADKLREREELEMARAKERTNAQEKELEGLTPAERKLKVQQMVEDADLENSKDAFMDGSGEDIHREEPKIDGYKPMTEKDFTDYGVLVGERLKGLRNPRRGYAYKVMVEKILRLSIVDMSAEDIRDLSSQLTVVANEKLKANTDKNKKSKKGGQKKTIKVERDDRDEDGTTYGGKFDEFDDFM